MNARPRVFVVDDERNIGASLKLILENSGFQVCLAESAREFQQHVHAWTSEAYLVDVKLPDGNGIDILRELRAQGVVAPVVMISGHATIADAVEATRAGAFDFLEKPLARDRVLIALNNALASAKLARENRQLRELTGAQAGIIGASPLFLDAVAQVRRAAKTDVPVLLMGETETGKELLASLLHEESLSCGGPYVKVNCAAIPAELIESELFGHEKGAFTGAASAYRGKFEQADKGTLFLDEIGELQLAAQAKLLRVLEDSHFQRLGGERSVEVTVRVVAATNRDLEELVRSGGFRQDLYYRLCVVPVRVPPLRERIEDVAALAGHFVTAFAQRHNCREKAIAPEALQALESHPWPGNVRELKNTVERMMILSSGAELGVDDLPDGVAHAGAPERSSLKNARQEAEREYLLAALNQHEWNVSAAARALGIERTHLHKRLKALSLRRG